ncbi:MAG: RNA methyltransferase [Bacteroidota bacterium]
MLSPRFPLPPTVAVAGRDYAPEAVLETLVPYLSDRRRERIDAVVAARSFSVLPALERVHDPGNVNAVFRSAEGLGMGSAALVDLDGDARELVDQYASGADDAALASERPIRRRQSQGAHKWMHVETHPSAMAFAESARARGYRVAVTALREDAMPIAEWDFSQPTALVFGAEQHGASGEMLDAADAALLLPIDGFVQSYNVSVAAALALYHARADRIARRGAHGDLSPEEQALLTAHYVARAVPLAPALLAHAHG